MHGGPSMRPFMHIHLDRLSYFQNYFLINIKNHPNDPQNIPTELKKITLEESLYSQVVMIPQKILVQKKNKKKYLK